MFTPIAEMNPISWQASAKPHNLLTHPKSEGLDAFVAALRRGSVKEGWRVGGGEGGEIDSPVSVCVLFCILTLPLAR